MSYLHDPISEMTREESHDSGLRQAQDEYEASLVMCDCGLRFESQELTLVETVIFGVKQPRALCPECLAIHKEQNS